MHLMALLALPLCHRRMPHFGAEKLGVACRAGLSQFFPGLHFIANFMALLALPCKIGRVNRDEFGLRQLDRRRLGWRRIAGSGACFRNRRGRHFKEERFQSFTRPGRTAYQYSGENGGGAIVFRVEQSIVERHLIGHASDIIGWRCKINSGKIRLCILMDQLGWRRGGRCAEASVDRTKSEFESQGEAQGCVSR